MGWSNSNSWDDAQGAAIKYPQRAAARSTRLFQPSLQILLLVEQPVHSQASASARLTQIGLLSSASMTIQTGRFRVMPVTCVRDKKGRMRGS